MVEIVSFKVEVDEMLFAFLTPAISLNSCDLTPQKRSLFLLT